MSQYEEDIKLSDLVPSPLRIREVQGDSEHFANLQRSIARHGFIRAMRITVRPLRDPETKKIVEGKFEICNGMQRVEACTRLKLPTIPAWIDEDLTDEQVQQLQYGLNESVPTSLKDKVAHFQKYCAMHPELTQAQIAEEFCVSANELSKILRFKNLNPDIATLVYSGKIKPTAAMQLVTVPIEYQEQFMKPAMEMPVGDFVNFVKDQRRAIAKARRTRSETVVFEHKPKLVTLLEGKKLHDAARELLDIRNLDDPEYKFHLGQVQMAEKFLQIDPETIAYKEGLKEQNKEEKTAIAAQKRAEKRLAEAQKNMEELKKRKTNKQPVLAESLA